MSKGPFYRHRPVYTLAFTDSVGAFSIEAHLEELNASEAARQGLDVARKNLEIFCCNPREGDPRIRHDMKASISPDFMGLAGTVTVIGRPDSRLNAVTAKMGVKLYGPFTESAASASDGMEAWTRRRFIPDGGETLTGGPSGTWQPQTVQLAFISERGDELDDFAPVNAQVTALANTLLPGDTVSREPHGTFEVRGVEVLGEYEKARLLR